MQRPCLSDLVSAQHGGINKKAPTGTAHTAIDRWGLYEGVRASILTLQTLVIEIDEAGSQAA